MAPRVSKRKNAIPQDPPEAPLANVTAEVLEPAAKLGGGSRLRRKALLPQEDAEVADDEAMGDSAPAVEAEPPLEPEQDTVTAETAAEAVCNLSFLLSGSALQELLEGPVAAITGPAGVPMLMSEPSKQLAMNALTQLFSTIPICEEVPSVASPKALSWCHAAYALAHRNSDVWATELGAALDAAWLVGHVTAGLTTVQVSGIASSVMVVWIFTAMAIIAAAADEGKPGWFEAGKAEHVQAWMPSLFQCLAARFTRVNAIREQRHNILMADIKADQGAYVAAYATQTRGLAVFGPSEHVVMAWLAFQASPDDLLKTMQDISPLTSPWQAITQLDPSMKLQAIMELRDGLLQPEHFLVDMLTVPVEAPNAAAAAAAVPASSASAAGQVRRGRILILI